MSKVKRGSKVARFIRSKPFQGVSETGKRWLIQNLDPFHDEEFEPVGYPDLNGSKTIVQCQPLSLTVIPPGSVTGTATWDANIFLLPEMVANAFIAGYTGPAPNAGNPVPITLTNQFTLGTLNSIAVPNGQSMITFGTTATGTAQPNASIQGVSPNTNWSIGNSRIVGMGFEVTNITSDLNAQGAVTVYRQPQVNSLTCMTYQDTNNNRLGLPCTGYNTRLFPISILEAKNFANSKTWSAKDGAYVVGTQFSSDNPLNTITSGVKKYSKVDTSYLETALYSGLFTSAIIPTTAIPVTYTGGWAAWKPAPFNTSGAYFTGLSASSVLQVECKVFIEKAPTADDTAVLGFARPSPSLDEKAFRLYARIIDILPVGVTVDENPLGEWFQRILSAVANYGTETGVALSTVIGPEAAILGKAASVAAKAASGIVKSTQNKLDSLNVKEKQVAQKVKTLEQRQKRNNK